jgi:hypothetical protein
MEKKQRKATRRPRKGAGAFGLVHFMNWALNEAPEAFPSAHAVRWHLRKHRKLYIEGGAIFMVNGTLYVNPPVFVPIFLKIAAEQAMAVTTYRSERVSAINRDRVAAERERKEAVAA